MIDMCECGHSGKSHTRGTARCHAATCACPRMKYIRTTAELPPTELDRDALVRWLEEAIRVSLEHEFYFEGRREVTGKTYHAAQREAFQMIERQVRAGKLDAKPERRKSDE